MRWEKEYLLELKIFHEVSQPNKRSDKVRIGDIVFLQEDRRPRRMWKTRVEKVKVRTDGAKRTTVLRRGDGRVLFCLFSLSSPWILTRVGRMWRITGTEYISGRDTSVSVSVMTKRILCVVLF
jgi:hypothetical protein